LDLRIGKSGVPLSYVIQPENINTMEAPDEYTHVIMWMTSFDSPPQFREDNHKVYHLFKDLLTMTKGATWFEKVSDGNGRAAHLLLREHRDYVSAEAHDIATSGAGQPLRMGRWKRSFGKVRLHSHLRSI
jgi:hypothetical protein